jgi:hypothetical protein
MISGNGFGWLMRISLFSMAAVIGCKSASGGTRRYTDINTPCAEGFMRCGPRCADVLNDFGNCGECGKICDAPRACVQGVCGGPDMVPPRQPVQADKAVKANVTADAAVNEHPATAENTIPTVTIALSGKDGGEPNAPQEADPDAAKTCGNRMTDVNNCGECGIVCSSFHAINTRCERGKCVRDKCEPGWSDCDDMPGCETSLASSENCGACRHVCPIINLNGKDVRLACPNGVCASGSVATCGENVVDLHSDANNCGRCGNICGKYELCKNGACICNDVGMCDKPKRASPSKKK